jgi:hypothetical protein
MIDLVLEVGGAIVDTPDVNGREAIHEAALMGNEGLNFLFKKVSFFLKKNLKQKKGTS